ncbi:MAG: Sua5 family C-terminal domain-containing protein, partial [Planctomycetota bacterium]
PRTPLVVVAPQAFESPVKSELRKAGQRVGILTFGEKSIGIEDADAIEHLSDTGGSSEQAAHNLFAALRRLDAAGVDLILAEAAPDSGLGVAINDRLRRASAFTRQSGHGSGG